MVRNMEKNAQRLALLNRKSVKWTAAVTALALSVSMAGCSAKDVAQVSKTAAVQETAADKTAKEVTTQTAEDSLTKAVYAAAGVSDDTDGENEKSETVYGILNADGSVDHIISENWLKNFSNADSLTVDADLSDITNVKGKESFTENNGTLTWAAGGNDIYYEGTTTKELPVSIKVTYYLDDKEIKPEDLKGQSGKVRIRYEYENLTKNTITVDGKNETVNTPFAVITGMILSSDTFSNIKTENAEIVSDGSNQIIVGCAFPGLQKSLGISDKDLKDISEDLTIPDYFEVTADVENFSMNMTLTVATSKVFSDNKDDIEDMLDNLDDISDDMDELQDGSTELVDGTEELHDGTKDLKDGAKELDDGAGDLKDGAKDLKDGASDLNDGATDLKDGAKKLNDGAGDLKDGASDLEDGAKKLKKGTASLKEGLDTLKEKSADLTDGIDSLQTGITQYTDGVSSLKEGADTLQAAYEGDSGAVAGAKALADGTKTLYDTVSNFSLDTSGMDIDVDLDMTNLIDAAAIQEECTKAAQAYLKENNIDPTTEEGQAIVKAFTAGSTAGTTAVSTAITTAVSTQKDAIAENVSKQIKEQIGETLTGTMTQLGTAAKQLSDGASALSLGVQQLYAGTKQLAEGVTTLDANSAALTKGTKTLAAGWSQYAVGVKSADKGAKTLLNGMTSLYKGTKTLSDGTVTLSDGTSELYDGTKDLKDGTVQLYDGTKDLVDGVKELKDGTSELYDGTVDLKDGAKELKDGMAELDEEGIQKLSDLFSGDLQKYADRMRGLLGAAEEYDNFTGSADNMENSVKFILKTAEISNEEDE